ncbi:MAG TPA: hypothetical protein VNM45_06800 [Bacillus sp. (in: firmicutes)]|nr:hypothetical protein [Bacillus sp. (in: firmicutes)]
MGKKVYALLFILFILAGCQLHSAEGMKDGEEDRQPVKQVPPIKTLKVDGSSFFSVGDWYDNETVLVMEDDEKQSNIYLYNLYTGEKKLFFQSENRIVSVKANHNHTYFLVQTTISDQQAELLFLDQEGKITQSFQMDSFDVQYVWNPYREDQVFVTTFFEDWTFQSFLLDLSNKAHEKYMLSQPFAQWLTKSSLAYVPINKDNPLGDVPLLVHDVYTKKEKQVLDGIVSFSAFPGTLLTVGPKQGEEGNGVYTFYKTDTLQKIQSLSMPLVSDVSGWIIPYHQFNAANDMFYVFQPRAVDKMAEAKGFQLLSFSLKTGKKKIIFEQIDNVPFKLSPNGQLGLMGYQSEKIIDLKSKKIIDFIKFT